MRLDRTQAVLVVIDVQERLLPVMDDHETLLQNLERLIRGCHRLDVPALVTEQYVKGLGATTAVLRTTLDESGGYHPIEKNCFSANGCAAFATALATMGRRQVLVAGIETHVCVYQTCIDLLDGGYEVTVIADAVSSRTSRNREIALDRLVAEGALLSSTEMALFELLVKAGTDEFRAISKLVK